MLLRKDKSILKTELSETKKSNSNLHVEKIPIPQD